MAQGLPAACSESARSAATYPRGSTACRGRGWHWRVVSRSASPGCSTASRSRWSARSAPRCSERHARRSPRPRSAGPARVRRRRRVGALLFGRLADRLGRKRLFLVTLGRLSRRDAGDGVLLDFASFALCRFFTGFGIGGEYAAINSAIDELIRRACAAASTSRSTAASGSARRSARVLSIVLLDPRLLGPRRRLARSRFVLGAVLGGRDPAGAPPRAGKPALADDARPRRRGRARSSREIEDAGRARGHVPPRHTSRSRSAVRAHVVAGARSRDCWSRVSAPRGARPRADGVAGVLLQRDLLHLRARADALLRCCRRAASGYYIFPFALGNFLGPLLLGRLFDRVGRRSDDRGDLRALGRRSCSRPA